MDFRIALAIQFSGIFLVAVLLFFLANSLKSNASKYWTAGWLCLSLSLASLYVAFTQPSAAKLFYGFYFLGEYAFSFLLAAGCRAYANDEKLTRAHWFWLVPGVIAASVLPFLSSDFNHLFSVHAFILATGFAISFYALWRAKRRRKNVGEMVMQTALALLALNFYHYSIANSNKSFLTWLVLPEIYLQFSSIFDLVLEILLSFGMVIVMLERVRHEVEAANFELKSARDQLERIAHYDPLTDAFNRHAFYGFLRHNSTEAVAGCVGVFDVDNLKPINDQLGHNAGDVAIRAVANAIRSVIRADDLLFRWGGDEFFVVMFGLNDAQARERMTELTKKLAAVRLDAKSAEQSVQVSYGFADFTDAHDIEKAIKQADAEMYRHKEARKKAANSEKPKKAAPKSSRKRATANVV